jgi:hypothetical protein
VVRLDDPRATLLNQPETFGPGTVAVMTDQLTRFSEFWFSAINVGFTMPDGSTFDGLISSDIAGARNTLVKRMLEREDQWIWFIDDDHTFPHEIVMRLLAHNVDIVGPLVLRRQSPFWPINTDESANFMDLRRYGPNELVKVMQIGTSGALFRRKVFEAVPEPWFEMTHDEQGRRVSEDIRFCQKAVEAGFDVHVDTSLQMSHMMTARVQAFWHEETEEWRTGITLADGYTIMMGVVPPPDPETGEMTEYLEAEAAKGADETTA